jgi:hypothetical protein
MLLFIYLHLICRKNDRNVILEMNFQALVSVKLQ